LAQRLLKSVRPTPTTKSDCEANFAESIVTAVERQRLSKTNILTYTDMFMCVLSMQIELVKAGLFWFSATILLGSPGPGIAALMALGRSRGFAGALRFFWGLQAGIATAAALCGLGLFSVVRATPAAMTSLSAIGTVYLIWLAFRIATAPVGPPSEGRPAGFASTASGGFLVGILNPKAYVAFVSLMAAYVIVRSNVFADVTLKWLSCVVIVFLVDVVWLWIGACVGRSEMGPRGERVLSVLMGSTVFVAALLPWI
jgi:threonine/homoserine/homoserine lactone efflux protein